MSDSQDERKVKSMSWGEEQKKEIETIRERKITVKLSDADYDRLARKCGEHGLTIGELIENFVGDLVDGTYSNGSDETIYANQWFDRCGFAMFPEPTLLNHLLSTGYDPENYLNTMDNIDTAKEEKKYPEEHPKEADEEEASYLDDDIADWEEELKSMREDWNPERGRSSKMWLIKSILSSITKVLASIIILGLTIVLAAIILFSLAIVSMAN